ncbi:hypothetical protein Anas_10555 [Armadillidium nasatum]|uniref:Uncharacterized protein n=1 Tax=Armadillidium nasatum TaxID=96803 RepID=A0A5N5SSB0_9CRUS|nr:hypothetical protein Anas_10555 [Armadillidium nasatum]
MTKESIVTERYMKLMKETLELKGKTLVTVLRDKFPCAFTTKLLITCGANVNEMDNNRNTPLHLINFDKPLDFFTLHNIILALVEAGAHMDTVNQSGATPMDAATSDRGITGKHAGQAWLRRELV